MGHFLCCWKCTKYQNDTTTDAGEGLRDEFEEEAEEYPTWLASFHAESEKEQSKRAIALAAATAAAADAAVAAVHAAVAVVRLTSRRSDWHERYWAAVKIQSAFRAYLARKALRALKALVKLQALIKGCLVRKQTALALQGMQTLMRIQTTMQSKRSPISLYSDAKSQPVSYHRTSLVTQQISSQSCSPKTNNSLTCFQETQQISSKSSSPNTINTGSCTSLPFSSPLPVQILPHLSLPRARNHRERSMTASNTPRFMVNECNGPHCPNYLASTRSFNAKVRSQSAPKQRPELTELMKRRDSFNESRDSLSGISKEGAHSYKNAVVGRIDSCLELSREDEEIIT